MLITRQLVQILALALPLAVAAFPQAMVNYGAAAAAGTAVGTAAGKRASDALTNIMNNAAGTAQAASNSADVAAAESKLMKDAKPASEYKSVVKAANMPGAPETSPSTAPSARGAKVKAEAPLVASLAHSVSPATGKSATGVSRLGASSIATVAGPAAPAEQTAEMPLTMQQVLNELHPVLEPMAERVQRIAPGNSRDDLKRILGAPASRVTIPADRDVTEIYYYKEKGHNIATIRLEAGSVTAVHADGI